jgi:2-oxoglutarate ferredoxin oxidoreductase subunit delta
MAESPKKIDSFLTWAPGFCKHCLTCVNICPVKNLEFREDEIASEGKCIQCELCQKYCPDFAIEVEPKKAEARKAKDKKKS